MPARAGASADPASSQTLGLAAPPATAPLRERASLCGPAPTEDRVSLRCAAHDREDERPLALVGGEVAPNTVDVVLVGHLEELGELGVVRRVHVVVDPGCEAVEVDGAAAWLVEVRCLLTGRALAVAVGEVVPASHGQPVG